ncbi:hypothetical protein BC835DRAFT_1025391 [Cytidiella melzeri]|nr:hypothetical protein BC835DRAFT_1025391 [Cytidiella melzeri]
MRARRGCTRMLVCGLEDCRGRSTLRGGNGRLAKPRFATHRWYSTIRGHTRLEWCNRPSLFAGAAGDANSTVHRPRRSPQTRRHSQSEGRGFRKRRWNLRRDTQAGQDMLDDEGCALAAVTRASQTMEVGTPSEPYLICRSHRAARVCKTRFQTASSHNNSVSALSPLLVAFSISPEP